MYEFEHLNPTFVQLNILTKFAQRDKLGTSVNQYEEVHRWLNNKNCENFKLNNFSFITTNRGEKKAEGLECLFQTI